MTRSTDALETAHRPAGTALPRLDTTRIGGHDFAWGSQTFVMGIINATPDSFSGDGLLDGSGSRDADHASAIAAGVGLAMSMVEAGADIVDIGGESTRPGHAEIELPDEAARVVPLIRAVRSALPTLPISVDTTKPGVAAAALEAGAGLINDVWGVADDDSMVRLAARHRVPIILMHNRIEARYTDLVAEVIADLAAAIERALGAGMARNNILIDPGFGFGKTPEHNLTILRELHQLAVLGRPIVLGTSRKSTLGKVLDLPVDQRLEATLATTALGIAGGADIVRVHDVRENVRTARMADAVVRGTWQEEAR